MNHKSVRMKRHRFTNAEREYVKGMAHNLSFQRLTDQEIVQWLHNEKQIDLDRSTISRMRNKVEREAEKWYLELRNSTYKYIAIYKERFDSLFSYQNKLHEIIAATKKDEIKIRAISELHSIEMDIFSLWKQLPDLQVQETSSKDNGNEYEYDNNVTPNGLPRAISYGPQEDEKRDRAVFFGWKEGDAPLNNRFRARMEEKYGVEFEPWDKDKWIDCSACKRWFKTEEKLHMHSHICPEPIV